MRSLYAPNLDEIVQSIVSVEGVDEVDIIIKSDAVSVSVNGITILRVTKIEKIQIEDLRG